MDASDSNGASSSGLTGLGFSADFGFQRYERRVLDDDELLSEVRDPSVLLNGADIIRPRSRGEKS
jgi:hypothetical protein